MLALVPAAALFVLAADVDAAAILVAESRAGEAPQQPGRAPTAQAAGILVPGFDLRLRFPEAALTLSYGARFFALGPSNLPATSPLGFHLAILHMASLIGQARVSRNAVLSGAGTASVGEPDYNALSGILGTTPQGTLPAVLNILALSGRVGVLWAASRLWDLGGVGEVGHYRSYGVPVGGGGGSPAPGTQVTVAPPLPQQTSVRLEPTAASHLTRRDDLLVVTGVSHQTYGATTTTGAFEVTTLSGQLGWKRQLSRSSGLRLLGGAAYGKRHGADPVGGPGPAMAPVGAAELVGPLFQELAPRRKAVLRGAVSVVLDYFVDPILGTAGSRASFFARLSLLLQPDWSAGLEAAFATSIRDAPLPGNPDETAIYVLMPVRHRLSDTLMAEGGLRGSDRGPNLRASDFAFRQREIWLYLSLTASTRPDEGHMRP